MEYWERGSSEGEKERAQQAIGEPHTWHISLVMGQGSTTQAFLRLYEGACRSFKAKLTDCVRKRSATRDVVRWHSQAHCLDWLPRIHGQ